MEDNLSKYLRLFGNIFFTFVGFLVAFVLVFLALRFTVGWLDRIPWFAYFYMLLILFLPAALFVSVFVIYFLKTKSHPSKSVRIFSQIIFIAFILGWGVSFVLDILGFYKNQSSDIDHYYSYGLWWLVANVASIFLIGIVQALSTEKEKDWLEKHGS
jgi:phosphoglycerol transferase MdoB-like AlkP superfamily enzyme